MTVCDECLSNADCHAQPGGECHETGDNMCAGPIHQICKYPDPACGGKVCGDRVTPKPP